MNRSSVRRNFENPDPQFPMKSSRRHVPTLHFALLWASGILLLTGSGPNAGAQNVPSSISYQGVLRTGSGAVVGPANLTINFGIYTSQTDTNQLLWLESQLVRIDTNGLFNVEIGGGQNLFMGPGIDSFDEVFTGTQGTSGELDRFLGLQVDDGVSGVILPMQQFLTAPFAMMANSAASAVNLTGDGVVTANNLANGAVTAAKLNIDGDFQLNDHNLYLGKATNGDGLGWNQGVNGPFLFGANAGALGTTSSGINYALKWTSDGHVGINTNTSPSYALNVNGSLNVNGTINATNITGVTSLFLSPSTSRLGIGTTTATKGMVEIDGYVDYQLNGNSYWFTNSLNEWKSLDDLNLNLPAGPGGHKGPFEVNSTGSISLHAAYTIRATSFEAFSDARTKRVIGRSAGPEDLETLLGIEISDYTMVDAVGKGNRPHKKVVAQQVEQVFPQAVSRGTDVVPDIYARSEAKAGWIRCESKTTPALKIGDRVQLITQSGKALHDVVEVADDGFRVAAPVEGPVFVYGREVSDFRSVDYDAINMLHVSATQELHRQLQAQRAEIGALQSQVRELLAREKEQAARFSALEDQIRKADRGVLEARLR